MDDESIDGEELKSRPPTIDDLLKICSELNKQKVKYIIIGGMAMVQVGFIRTTMDIDILIDASPENQEGVKNALLILPDKAILELLPNDLNDYLVVRVADEIIIDLMIKAGGCDYQKAGNRITIKEIKGVKIPFASAELLYELKQTYREKDKMDFLFLKELLRVNAINNL